MPSGYKAKLSEETISIIIDKYKSGVSARELAKEFGFKCQKSIIRILEKNNINTRSRKESAKLLAIKFTNEEVNVISNMNNDPLTSLNQIAKKIKVDPGTIKKYLINNGSYNKNKYDNFLINKFDLIDSEEKAYWLGMLAADGVVSNKQLSLGLSIKDNSHLLKFKKFIGVDYNINTYSTYLKSTNKTYNRNEFRISSTAFTKSLKKHGLIKNKSLVLKFPNTIPTNLIKHYIRGLVDGDGSFYTDKSGKLYFSLISSFDVCNAVQELLINNCQVKKTKLEERVTKNGKSKFYYLRYCGSAQCARIASYLYDNSNIFLDRKKELVDNFTKTHKFKKMRSS